MKVKKGRWNWQAIAKELGIPRDAPVTNLIVLVLALGVLGLLVYNSVSSNPLMPSESPLWRLVLGGPCKFAP